MSNLKEEYTDKLKKVQLARNGVDVNELDRYTKYITADDKKEIEEQAAGVAADIKGKKYADTSVDKRGKVWRPFD